MTEPHPLPDPLPEPFPGDAAGLMQLALTARQRTPGALSTIAQRLGTMAGRDVATQIRAGVVHAWSDIYIGRLEQARSRSTQVQALTSSCFDRAAVALATDLAATMASVAGHNEESVQLASRNLELPDDERSPFERTITYMRLAVGFERLGRLDEALRWRYRHIDLAAGTGDAWEQAAALAGAGGLQLSLNNLEDAAVLCEQAWQLMAPMSPISNPWAMSAMNWLMVLKVQRRDALALPLADQIETAEAALPSINRHKRKLLLASLFARTGPLDRAQRLLDEGLALNPHGAQPPVEWVWTQAQVWNQQGRHADAWRICQTHLKAGQDGQLPEADLPVDLAALHGESSLASEALGDLANALRSNRAWAAAEQVMASTSARARRMTLQVQFELDSARRDRDSALQRERDAEQERQRLAELNIRLEEANLAKSRFLAAASHDLRQPIHALGLQLAHLRSGVATGESLAVAERMERTVESLRAMFDALLDISRMDAGVVTPRLQAVAMRPFLARLVDEFTPLAQSRGLYLGLHVAARVDASTHTDPDLLESMVRNLLGNALKYTTRGGALVALRPRGGAITLEIWDTGSGIAPAEQERVFEEFYQIDNSHRDSTQGLGLGLAIVRRLSHLLDHPLRLDSRPGQGTRFAISLPRRRGADPAQPVLPARPMPPDGTLRLAVIEDDDVVRQSMATLMRGWGHSVVVGQDADDIRRQIEPGACLDAVIADYRLAAGRLGPTEAQRLAGQMTPPPALLIVTGESGAQALRDLAQGGTPWLSKPLQPARLRSWLDALPRPGDPGHGPVDSPSAGQGAG